MTSTELHDLPPTVTRESVAHLPDATLDDGVSGLPELSAHVAILSRKDTKMTTAIEPARAAELANQVTRQMTPMDMVYQVVQSGQPIEVVREMMALSREIKREQAREAFDAAIAKAKAEIKPITRNAEGHNKKRYADFSAIAQAIDPILSRHGLSYRFKTSQTDRITVTCVLSHEGGHAEETTLSGQSDTSGNKNAIQAIGSTLTYLSRYSLMAALGLAASTDDDGHAAGKNLDQFQTITPDQVKIILALIDDTASDAEKFCEIAKISSVPEMLAIDYENAFYLLTNKKAKMAQRVAS